MTYKGTPSGKAFHFSISSMFCFASINPPITEQSDDSRISILEYTRLNAARWSNLDTLIHQEITKEKCSSLRNLTISNIYNVMGSIQKIHIFLNSMVENARFADQYAALIAGFWHLDHVDIIGSPEMENLINETFEGKNHTRITESKNSDCEQCLDDILTIGLPMGGGKIRSIYGIISEIVKTYGIGSEDLKSLLGSYGISFSKENTHLQIHHRHTEFMRLLSKTQWVGGVQKVISRIPGVEVNVKTRIAGRSCSAIRIPVELIVENVKT